MLIRHVEIDGQLADVRIGGGVIQEITSQISRNANEACIDGMGGALIPGLHDHHIHLNASAAALNSLKCGPPDVHTSVELIASLNGYPGDEWLRGTGYHQSVAGELDRFWLDKHGPGRPIRIQHRSGRLWVFNSAALDLLDLEIPENGRLLDGDDRVRAALGNQRPDLQPLVRKLLSCGITGVTEVTPDNDRSDLAHYVRMTKPLRLSVMGGTDLHDTSEREGTHVGPLKIHNHEHDLPPLSMLVDQIADSHDHDRAVAIHCVTRAELMLSLAAIEEAGVHPGDRIEHAAIADEACIGWMKRLELTIVTQPHFVRERGSAYIEEVDANDRPHLWRLKSFADAGLKMAGGSDAPFGSFDPWAAMASAVERCKQLGPDEAIDPEAALALYTKPVSCAGGVSRRIATGEPADMCLLDQPWTSARQDLANVTVCATWISGEKVHDNISSTSPHSSAV